MDNQYNIPEHKKGQHLTAEERHLIEVRINVDKVTVYAIAKELGRPYNTIKNEIARGTVSMYNGKVQRYKAKAGEEQYRKNRQSCRRKIKSFTVLPFIKYVVKHFTEDRWSLDSCFGRARLDNEFNRCEMVCTKTLYNYVDLGLLPIKNYDLPEKLSRNTKTHRATANKRILGQSIDDRPEEIDMRAEFGHWEIDSVIGKKNANEPVVATIVERKLRKSIWIKAANHSAEAMQESITNLISEFGDEYKEIFKSITADNGSEFALLGNLEKVGIPIYFTHPYTSCEKGTNECHNKMLRRFIPKGRSISDYSADDILYFADVINNLPRKILGYHTPDELFEAELDRIYAA